MPIHRLRILFPNLDEKLIKSHIFCIVCPTARQTRACFHRSNSKIARPLEMLHIDVWGPLKYPTRTQCNNFISIVDHFSKMTWIYIIKNKSDFPTVIKQFVSYMKGSWEPKFFVLDQTMQWSSPKVKHPNFMHPLVSLISLVVLTHPNKMGWLRRSISTFLKSLDP